MLCDINTFLVRVTAPCVLFGRLYNPNSQCFVKLDAGPGSLHHLCEEMAGGKYLGSESEVRFQSQHGYLSCV